MRQSNGYYFGKRFLFYVGNFYTTFYYYLIQVLNNVKSRRYYFE